jgi:anti-sigma regulatory factor (Ser/Thr protein kinase)
MISDLSPPGLYDLGLGPALQWLAVYVRGHDPLQVDLSVEVSEEAIRVEVSDQGMEWNPVGSGRGPGAQHES